MLKRTALVLTLAAALLAAAPTAPLAPAAPTAPLAPAAADNAPGHPAWGHYLYGKSTYMGMAGTFACSVTPYALALGGAAGMVFGLACGLTSAA